MQFAKHYPNIAYILSENSREWKIWI